MPLVSVLMPVYNEEKYVSEAIKSILKQTFTDFELIVLDDCSTDNSQNVISSFNDERIIIHRNEMNKGLAHNLNIGLKMAKGKYIARMDGDDISLPDRLRIQVNFLESNPDFILCSTAMKMFGTVDKVWIRDFDPEEIKITMMFYSPVLHASSMFRKEIFKKHDLYYNQDAFPAEDYELWSRAIFFGTMINLPDVLYLYRIHGVQVTMTDYKATIKSKEIQTKYIQHALPSLSKQEIVRFIDLFVIKKEYRKSEILTLKNVYLSIIKANKKTFFFNQKQLKKNLKKLYQNKIYIYLGTICIKTYKDFLHYVYLFAKIRTVQQIKSLFFENN